MSFRGARAALVVLLAACLLITLLRAKTRRIRALLGELHEVGLELEVERSELDRRIREASTLGELRRRHDAIREAGRQ
ncbi:MAG: hypothetical protein R3F30_02990 [Planctomycetota bacterium]